MTMLNSQWEPRLGPASGAPRGAHVGGLWQEQPCSLSPQPEIIVARWTDTRTEDRREAVVAPDGQFVLGVALTPTRVRLRSGGEMIFDGVMASGMTYVCHPSQTLHAEFAGPADFLHLYVAGGSIHKQQTAETSADMYGGALLATMLSRDALIDQLARAVQTAEDGADESYVETLARAIVMRTTQIRQRSSRVSSLPKWRLKRVTDYIEAHISEAISLADMAAAAGLSRTHFTAQFRIATGCKPHDFILLQRIEAAKRLLVETSRQLLDIALTVGFQAQAHFSTVFKRFVGETPGRWRRTQLAERSQTREAA
ncbi:MAG: transcriptional regulator [Gammaproteobacteria bacterium]|jgi:AraC family transcriptional regulator|nr:transcriptional regulator [Gammaproteobacteria bacterium]